MNMPRLGLIAVTAAALAGCASRAGIDPRAVPNDPAGLEASRAFGTPAAGAAWPRDDWWTGFGDAQLDALIREALAKSPSVRLALARIDQAIALVETNDAGRLPLVTGSFDSSRQRFSENGQLANSPLAGRWRWNNQAQIGISQDLDLWGRNAASRASSLGQLRAADADAQAARLALAAGIAHAYVQLARAGEALELARETLARRERQLALQRARFDAGLDSAIELKNVEALLPDARLRVALIEEAEALSRHQIAALLGRGPDRGLALERPKLALLEAPGLPAVLPADLLGRRPDVVASRWRVEASAREVDLARAQFYPNINIVAYLGLQAFSWAKFLEAGSRIAGVGPAVRLPIFDGGRLRANLGGRTAAYDAAVEQYNQALADALRDVANQAATLRSLAVQQAELEQSVATARALRTLADSRWRAGLGNELAVVTTEIALIARREAAADLQARRLDAAIDLTRALGGGYRAESLPAALSSKEAR